MNLKEIEKSSRSYEKFIKKITISKDGCWNMGGFKDKDGYAQFHISRKTNKAHRISYEFHKGKIPEGLVIDHLCKNRGCVNPDHLEAVTIAENNKRADQFDIGKWMNDMPKEKRIELAKKGSDKAREILLKKKHCRRGHEWKKETTYINPKGHKRCQICFYNTPSMSLKNKKNSEVGY